MDIERAVLDVALAVVLVTEPGLEVPGVGHRGGVVGDEGELALNGAGEPRPVFVDRPVEDGVESLVQRPGVAGARVSTALRVGDVVLVLGKRPRAVAVGQRAAGTPNASSAPSAPATTPSWASFRMIPSPTWSGPRGRSPQLAS